MTYNELNTNLNNNLVSGTLTIGKGMLTATVDELIDYCYDSGSIVINSANINAPNNQPITVTGISDYLGVTGINVTANFSIDGNGNVQLECIYALPGNWKFSDSFPNLPKIPDHAEPVTYYAMAGEEEISIAEATALDRFAFEYPTLVVTTVVGSKSIKIYSDPDPAPPNKDVDVTPNLQWGINFVSNLQPTGMLLALGQLFNHTDALPVFGTIRPPFTGETVDALTTNPDYATETPVAYPWDKETDFYAQSSGVYSKGIPGILLKTTLHKDGEPNNNFQYTIRNNVNFTANSLYIYTPLHKDWLSADTNPAFVPLQAYTGILKIEGNGFEPITMNMVNTIDVGRDILSLEAHFQNLNVNNILHLAGLTNDDTQSPAGNLPAGLSSKLGTLSLTDAGVSITYYNDLYEDPNILTVNHMHFTAGFPNLNWHVWGDHIVVDNILCSFDFDYPFHTAATSFSWEAPSSRIGLTGELKIENVPFTVYGDLYRSDRNYHEFYAEMDASRPLPLNTIIAKYAGGVPSSFGSLSINTFRLSITPGLAYSMAMTAAEAPDAWQIALPGGTQLNIQDIAFLISYIKDHPESSDGALSGELSGTFTLGSAPNTISFSLAGAIHKDIKGIGWSFTGHSASDSPVSIGNLMTDLATKFGITTNIPQPISSLSLSNLAIAFDTQSKDFRFSGEATGNDGLDIKGKKFDIKAQVNISHKQDGSTQKSFSGSLKLGSNANPKIFDVLLNGDIMLASYSDAAGHTNFDVGELINAMFTEPKVHSGLTISLHNAFMTYMNSKFVFSIDVGNNINLSNLPLVGQLFPKGKTLSLSCQIQYASDIFINSEVTSINATLPTGVHPLLSNSNGEMPQGLNLAVSMNLGTEIISFDLGLVASGSLADPNAPHPNDVIPENQAPVVPKSATPSTAIQWFNLQKNMGPVHFNRIGVGYSSSNGGSLKFALDASFSMGGLDISLDGLSVSSPLASFIPHFDVKGLGIAYKNPVIAIGGAFLKEHIGDPAPGGYDEFDGAALLKMKMLSINAIGSYAYVNGKPSLFIYAALNYPLGGPPFFFVTGISLGFGYNRALRMPSINKVLEFPLVAEAISGASLPANAGKQTLTDKLKAIHHYVPVSIGNMFLAAGIRFTTFKLIDSTILLAASFGNRFELDLLGVSTLVVPPQTNKTPLAVIQMTLKGAFIPDEGFVGLQGQLTSASYVLSKNCHLSGGFAFYAWYKGVHAGDFVTTIGGYHPHFNKPDHYPSVPRLAFNWQLDAYTHIKGDAYFALCAHALMAGGHLEAVYEKGKLKAWYKVGADFLVAWKPYHYEASVYVNIGASYTYKFFGTHHITIDVGADVNIWGPEFGGHATVHLWICSIGVDFGASHSTHTAINWNTFNSSFLHQSNPCNVTVSSGMVGKGSDSNDLGIVNPKELALITDAFIPSKDVYFGREGLIVSINKHSTIATFPVFYNDITWTVETDTQDTTTRTIVLRKEGHSDQNVIITLSDNSVIINGQTINNPDTDILVSKPIGTEWTTAFGIGPMGIASSDLNCSQAITVERYNGTHWADHSSHFTHAVISKKAPAGLWGEKLNPSVNDTQFIDNAFAGLEITPANVPVAGAGQSVSTSFVQYTTSSMANAIKWETRDAFTDAGLGETAARTAVNSSIKTHAGRDTLLASLGIAATIDLTNTIADDLILAPQVEQVIV